MARDDGAAADPLADRYGTARRRAPRRLLVAVAAVVIAVATVVAAVLAAHYADRTRGEMLSYDVLSEREVSITWSVHRRDPGRATECALRARNRAGEEVGRIPLAVPAGGPSIVTGTTVLPTRDLAVTGEVEGCRAVPG